MKPTTRSLLRNVATGLRDLNVTMTRIGSRLDAFDAELVTIRADPGALKNDVGALWRAIQERR